MSALLKIRASGFYVSLVDEFVQICPAYKLTATQREFLKQHKASIINELKVECLTLAKNDVTKILDWLASIGESDQEIIDDTISRCKTDPETLSYFLQRADGLVKPH